MVYLLYYNKPIHHAKHYMGCTSNLSNRIKCHRNGNSKAHLPMAFHKLGIGFEVSRIWDGDFALEKKLKKYKNNRRLCPFCQKKKTK